jgi:hypothetical protein
MKETISSRQFALFRIVFGLYLAWHFVALIPYGPELFSSKGVLPEASANLTYRAFPNLLAIAGSPLQVTILLGVCSMLAICFAVGWHRRLCAVALWYGWACLFNRNNLISNPGIPYVGLLLVMSVLVPKGESLRGERDSEWQMPAMVYWGAWFLLAAGYTYSGYCKLLSPSWQDGSAIYHLLTNPLARPGPVREWLLGLPWYCLVALTWLTLVGELVSLPLSLTRRGRMLTWGWMMAMHLSVLVVVDFADLTFGMVMIHLFTFDPEWLGKLRVRRQAVFVGPSEVSWLIQTVKCGDSRCKAVEGYRSPRRWRELCKPVRISR